MGIPYIGLRIKFLLILFFRKPHSANQRYYLLNMEDLLNEFSENTVAIIRKYATIETIFP